MSINNSINLKKDNFEIIFSDDEFDSLLATIPLPGFNSPIQTLPNSNSKRKKQDNNSEEGLDESDSVYEPLKFGEISKYMANKRKKLKLQESAIRDQLPSGSKPPQIFSGMVIHINGYTSPPLSELRNMIILHGGTYMAYLDHKSVITHIIASTLTPKKLQEFRNYKVIKPEWVVKSISAGRSLNWSNFRLMGPSALTEDKIAKGEFTGGKPVAQKTLFNLSKAPLSSLSIQSSSRIPSQNQTPQSLSSSPRKALPSSHTSDTLLSSVQSTLKPISTRSSNEASQKINYPDPIVDSSNTSNNLTTTSPLNPSKQIPPKNHSHNPQRSSHTENHEEMINMPAISCTDPDFIQKYFQQSRLHHLSAWKADLLHRVSILSEKKQSGSKNHIVSKKKSRGDSSDKRVIMHVDFDCFFISAGLIRRPELRGKPLAVCHAKAHSSGRLNSSTSEIASCSYEARAFGVQSGQTLGKAQQLCPEIQTIPYEFELYEDLSLKFYNILLSYADELQAVSVDECLIDVSSRFTDQFSPSGVNSMVEPNALKFAEEIRTVIRKETQCEASIGISYNVLLAKLATKKAKPRGSFFLGTNRAQNYLNELSIDQLPGFGWAQKNEIEQKLPSVQNVGDIRTISLSRLIEVLGPTRGKTLHQYAQGIDDRSLKSADHQRKSVSAVINYGIRFKPTAEGGKNEVQTFLRRLGLEVSRRLTELNVSGLQLTLKVMKRAPNAPIEPSKYMGHGICEEFSKSTKLSGQAGVGVNDGIILGLEAWKLLESMAIQPEDLRGIGIQINRLEKCGNGDTTHKLKVQSTLSFQTTKAIGPISRRSGTPPQKGKYMPSTRKVKLAESGLRTLTASISKRTSSTRPQIPHSTPVFIPPASQLDLDVVNELPATLKTHILKSVSITPISIVESDPIINPVGNLTHIDLVTPQKNSNFINIHPNNHGLPSATQVDWKLLSELPSSVRKPIEVIYKNQRKYRSRLPPPTPPNFNRGPKKEKGTRFALNSSADIHHQFPPLHLNVSKLQRNRKKSSFSHRVAPIGPSQKLINKKTFQLVTQKNQPKKNLLAQKEADDEGEGDHHEVHELLPTPNKITDQQLEALEIDPIFFRELNRHNHHNGNSSSSITRAFQLDLIWNQFEKNSKKFKKVTNLTDKWKKWRNNFDNKSHKQNLMITLKDPPKISSKKKQNGIFKLNDVLNLIDSWVIEKNDNNDNENKQDMNSMSILLPIEIDERDICIIEDFLIGSIHHHSVGSIPQDFEKVTKIIQWWEYLVLSNFNPNPNNHLDSAFRTWSNIIDRIKFKINSVSIRDFGAPIY